MAEENQKPQKPKESETVKKPNKNIKAPKYDLLNEGIGPSENEEQ